MKLLTTEELKGLESTSKTIEKWKEFFKTGLLNLGYRDDILKKMYDYSIGLPMKDGTRLVPNQNTGRLYFQMSEADKLLALFSIFHTREDYAKTVYMQIEFMLANLWRNPELLRAFFPDLSEKQAETDASEISKKIEELKEEGSVRSLPKNQRAMNSFLAKSKTIKDYWCQFIDNCDIYQSCSSSDSMAFNAEEFGYITNERKEKIKNQDLIRNEGLKAYITYKPFENLYDGITSKILKEMYNIFSEYNLSDSYAANKLRANNEVYLQKYLVISLNPIDKFMLSTKQAFGSCMSIAKQNQTNGTNSEYAFGLPALFETSNVWLTFMTPGKHKNMYWEQEEWVKDPAERDPEKAYKYLKMTCRSLTYIGEGHPDYKALKDGIPELKENERKYVEELNALDLESERVFVGRQYSAAGEDYIWQDFIHVLMDRYGINTAQSDISAINAFKNKASNTTATRCILDDLYNKACKKNYNFLYERSSLIEYALRHLIRVGKMTKSYPISIDRYGYARGIYYDNLRIYFNSSGETRINSDKVFKDTDKIEDHISHAIIRIGSSRSGSGGLFGRPHKSGLDMFKLLTGEQDYSYYNSMVRICEECKELINSNNVFGAINNKTICKKCAEKLKVQKCPSCGELYFERDADKHELIDLSNYAVGHKKIKVCKKNLERAVYSDKRSGHYICGHCGKVEPYYAYAGNTALDYLWKSKIEKVKEFGNKKITFGFCDKCADNAIICDKCKTIVFIDTVKDACLLLPSKKVLCPDCISSLRLAKDKKKELLEGIVAVKEEYSLDDSFPERAARTKNIRRQTEYLKKAGIEPKFKDLETVEVTTEVEETTASVEALV